jgi:hypothetical protein
VGFFFGFFLPLIHCSYLFFPGTYWDNVVPRGTASATKWAFVLASAAPTKEGWSFLFSLVKKSTTGLISLESSDHYLPTT